MEEINLSVLVNPGKLPVIFYLDTTLQFKMEKLAKLATPDQVLHSSNTIK